MSSTCVFVGPSLPALARSPGGALDVAPPIRRGDLAAAVDRGVRRVAIIDGEFSQALAVSVLEIRHALSRGVEIWGASSMGALRAAECDRLGMRGVGWIYERYRDAVLTSDDEVALTFHPVTRQALTVPLVNVRWTLELATNEGVVSHAAAEVLLTAARRVHFSERRWEHLARAEGPGSRERAAARAVLEFVARDPARCDRKRLDALQLLETCFGVAGGGAA